MYIPRLNQDICVSCNEVITETVLPVLEHQFGEYRVVVAPGKNKHGVQVRVCSVCNKGEFSTLICSHENSSSEVVREPDCYNIGTREIICLDCSTVIYQDIDTVPHAKTASFITKDATCFSEGERADVCVLCGKFAASEAIPVSDHSYGDWIIVEYPTPVTPGSKHRICKLCGNFMFLALEFIVISPSLNLLKRQLMQTMSFILTMLILSPMRIIPLFLAIIMVLWVVCTK